MEESWQTMPMKFSPDPWLAGMLGCDVFRVTVPDKEQALPSEADLVEASDGRAAFFYAKVRTDRVKDVGRLQAVGFDVVDVNVTFEREWRREREATGTSDVVTRDATPADASALLEIAGTCFVYSRFHQDPRIPLEVANRVKRGWVESYLEGRRGDRLLVADVAGVPSGFLAALSVKLAEQTLGVIDLIGVRPERQGSGVGRALVDAFVCGSPGIWRRWRVGTQVANIPSVRLYERCGFRLVESSYVLHAHMRKGQVLR